MSVSNLFTEGPGILLPLFGLNFFTRLSFAELMLRNASNAEAHTYCKAKVKEGLVIEQDPFNREEEAVVEELVGEEEL